MVVVVTVVVVAVFVFVLSAMAMVLLSVIEWLGLHGGDGVERHRVVRAGGGS